MATISCPRCGSVDVVPIGYGTPTADLVAMVRAGDVHVSAEEWREEAPDAHCKDCGHEWRNEPLESVDDDVVEIDPDELARWIHERIGVELDTVRGVLAVEEEFQIAIGLIDAPDTELRFYDRADWVGHPPAIDDRVPWSGGVSGSTSR